MFDYDLVRTDKGLLVLAEDLREACLQRYGLQGEVLATAKGARLELLELAHPFHDRKVPDRVRRACHARRRDRPRAHGARPRPGRLSPSGSSTTCRSTTRSAATGASSPASRSSAARACGTPTTVIVGSARRERGALLKAERITHSYPHCWRHKTPIIFRATTPVVHRHGPNHHPGGGPSAARSGASAQWPTPSSIPRGAARAWRPWCATDPTGAYRASAAGACRCRSSCMPRAASCTRAPRS